MIEIGKQKLVVVKKRSGSNPYLVPVIGPNGHPETKLAVQRVYRITRGTLSGKFGRDRNRRLVVGLVEVDRLTLRPQGTRQEKSIDLHTLYEILCHREAMNKALEKARARKSMLSARRERQKLARMERKVRKAVV